MDSIYTIIVVVLAMVIIGLVLGLIFAGRNRTGKFQEKFGPEYEHTVKSMGNDKKAQTELDNRKKHVDTLNIRSLSEIERERYLADWAAVQSKFVDEPGKAIKAADRLIMEVMLIRDYPVSDFDQRAADISINYPSFVSNYRAARAVTIKNNKNEADTEDLRLAMINYRSLFDELLETESDIEMEKEFA